MSYTLIRNMLSFMLLTAAGLKAYALAAKPILGAGLFDSRWLLIGVVEFEFFFGLWLLSGILPKPTWLVALGCFALFACASVYKAVLGYTDCACFGRVPVSPWYMAAIDLTVVALLAHWRPAGPHSASTTQVRLRAIAVIVTWVAVGVPAAFAMETYATSNISGSEYAVGNRHIVVLHPETWIGKRFPLLDYIDIGQELDDGAWLVVLVHHDCPECQQILRGLPHARGATSIQQVAVIELPPYGDSPMSSQHAKASLRLGRLDEERDWFVSTPVLVELSRGRVTGIPSAKRNN